MNAGDPERIVADTFVRRVDFHEAIGSTNDRAIELAAPGDLELPALVLAQRQTAGRGRGGNPWWTADGALTFSLLIDDCTLPPALVSLITGLAVADALDGIVDVTSRVKWPNDVYIAGRKVCGILPEQPQGAAGPTIIGIGVNVNNAMTAAPRDIRDTAVALIDVDGRTRSLTDVLIALLQSLERAIASGSGDLQSRWQTRCLLTGAHVHATAGNRKIEGYCRGITDDGAIILDTPAGRETLISATIDAFARS